MSHRHLRLLAILAVTLAGSLAALQPGAPPTPARADEHEGEAVIELPVRWCAVEGSIAATTAAAVQDTDPTYINRTLLDRQARANDTVWLPGAQIKLRSAFTTSVSNDESFPVIADPRLGPGDPGDILDPEVEFESRVEQGNVDEASELTMAIASCREAWDAIAMKFGTTLLGPIALNVGEFVDDTGARTIHLGWGGYTTWSPKAFHPCVTPSGASIASDGYFAVVDFSVIEEVVMADAQLASAGIDAEQLDASAIAHELGHVLYLGHGDGEDDDDDGFYDQWCDPWELPPSTPQTVMHPEVSIAPDVITPLQRATSRDIAYLYTGSQITSDNRLVSGPVLSDQRADTSADGQAPSVDLTYVELALNESYEAITFTQGLLGLVDPYETNEYLAFIDLDNSDVTGGMPAELGFPTQATGVDLVIQVVVTPDRLASATVLQLGDNGVMDVSGQYVDDVQLVSSEGGEVQTPLSDVVTIRMSLGVIDGFDLQEVGVQAVARQSDVGGGFDVFPGATGSGSSSETATLRLVAPEFPSND